MAKKDIIDCSLTEKTNLESLIRENVDRNVLEKYVLTMLDDIIEFVEEEEE